MKIKIENVQKKFKQGENNITVLDDVTIEIKTGEVISLLGKSGSGKSTLLALIAGLDRPDLGAIYFDNINIAKLSENELCSFRASNLGIVFQQFNLLPHLTALENVLLPLEINGVPDIAKAIDWLSLVGLKDRAHHFPSMLSGGEQQRVAIARALVFGPPILLADEPTGNLDTETGKTIIKILFDIVREKKITMILVTHDEELALRTDRIVRLKDGKCLI
jgi:putative ABC transport system ATP-binding protein